MQQEYHSLIWIIFDNNQTITSWCKIEDNYGYELSLESRTFFLIIEKSYPLVSEFEYVQVWPFDGM